MKRSVVLERERERVQKMLACRVVSAGMVALTL